MGNLEYYKIKYIINNTKKKGINKLNINININKDGISDQDIDKILDVLEGINYEDILSLCDGDEMQFNKGLISIKIEDNKDYKPMVITHRNN